GVALCTDKCTGQLAACHQAMLLTPVILHRISKEPLFYMLSEKQVVGTISGTFVFTIMFMLFTQLQNALPHQDAILQNGQTALHTLQMLGGAVGIITVSVSIVWILHDHFSGYCNQA
ncbi:MAG: hypothetical protein HY513_03360, partial [Candidatus Aenigmarchaeota archaeon]|nr:hypothetical protein [Candidatus Aenigmarchaeota archaeon]